ncbi:hypothetical protein AAD001_17680 [Colwelliaceae bacterium 6471]
MEAMSKENVIQERRHNNPGKSGLWNKLSITQKFAATGLTQFGYDLSFVRKSDSGNMAIMLCGNNAATVNSEGDVDTSPEITIR